jgi:hypothetical protein
MDEVLLVRQIRSAKLHVRQAVGGLPSRNFGGLAKRGRSRYQLPRRHHFWSTWRSTILDCHSCFETIGLQIGLAGRDRFLIPFEANARHIGNVKQSVTNFIGHL